MAGEERDARLILRAEDRASRTFEQVAASIKNVRKEISDQSKAATEGTADLAAMTRQLSELQKAGDDLIQGQSLIRQFEGTSEAVQKAEDRLKAATAALETYKAKVGDTPTAPQQNQLDKKGTGVERAQASLDKQNEKLAEVTARLERAGISTEELDRDFHRIAASAVEAAQGIASVKTAIDEYPEAVRRAAAAAEEFKAATAFDAKDKSFVTPNEFEFIQSLDSAKAKLVALVELEGLEARSQATAANAEKQRRAEQLAGINAVLAGNAELDAQFKVLIDDEQRLADLAKFQGVGARAAEDAVKVERYAASITNLGNDFQSLSETVRASLGGTQSGLQSIAQAFVQIDASAELLEGGKAKINALSASSGQLAIAIATLDRTARQIDGFKLQQQAVAAAEATFAEAQAEVIRLAEAIRTADAPSKELAGALTQAERALDLAGKAMQRERNNAIELGDALKRAGVDIHNLDTEHKRFADGAQKAGTAAAGFAGKLKGRGGFLGLNAFELQNLGYQVNDVFTQIGSGTPILQVVAQQGGQVIQIFQGLALQLLRLSPLIVGVGVLLLPFIDAAIQASKASAALREANVLLSGAGDPQAGAASQYAAASVALQQYGVKAKDATAALEEFHSKGLDPAALGSYVQALADAQKGGNDLSETSKLLTDALSGGTKEIENLNDKFHILTPAEEDQIAKMIESGNASEARRILFEKFSATVQTQSDNARGPWSKSWDSLTESFHRFTAMISQAGPFNALNGFLDSIGNNIRNKIADLTYFFNYASKRGFFGAVGDAITGRAAAGSDRANAQNDAAAFANGGGRAPVKTPQLANGQATLEGTRAIRDRTQAYEDQQRSLKKLTRAQTEQYARDKALKTARGNPQEIARQVDLAGQTALLKFDDDASKAAAAAAKKRDAAGRKAASAAETLANKRRAIEEQLKRDLDGLDEKAGKTATDSIEARRAGIKKGYTAVFQKIEEARRLGVSRIGDQSLAQYEAAVRAQITILQNAEEQKVREQQINDTIKARGDKIKDIQDQLARGDITPEDAFRQFGETISEFAPKIEKMSADALAFAKSLRGATPDPKLEAFISRLERIQQQNSGGQDKSLLKELDENVIGDQGKKLQELVQERDALVAAQNHLVELGLKTRSQAQDTIEAAYGRTNPLIAAQIDQMKKLLAAFVAANPEMQTFYDTWIAKLDGVAASGKYVDARFTQLKQGIDNIISSNAVDAIDNIAQSFSRLALGQQSAVDTLLQVGAAFLSFIAQTIIGIAKLIIQMIILDAIQKITGIPVGALLKFMNATGLHSGGVVGQERTFGRSVPSMAFANAPKYHGGGVAGFAPDEVPAILKRNEEVLTETDPRHRFNMQDSTTDDAGAGGSGTRQILVLDPAELANALAGPAGEKTVISHIRRNKTTLKQIMQD